MVIRSNVDINFGAIKVKKPFQVNETIQILDVCYDTDALLIQTSVCVIPYSYNIFDSGAFQIDIVSNDNLLRGLIANVTDYILKKIIKYDNSMLENKTYIDYLKVNKSSSANTEFRLRFRNPHVDNVSTFDYKNNAIPTKSLLTFDRVVCLFQVQKLIVQKDTYYFQANIVQIKKVNLPMAVIKTCLIETLVEEDQVIRCDECDNIQYTHNTQPTQSNAVTTPKAPPLPPPPPPMRVVMNPPLYVRKTVDKRRSVETPSLGYKAPTLDEILKARTNLKPINNISI